jgi:hypothetical protein
MGFDIVLGRKKIANASKNTQKLIQQQLKKGVQRVPE